mgnify:FL=1|tara:strand:- start:4592 stop:5542 length:951 start_codon:yes stop_codon:yes gene_type:complete
MTHISIVSSLYNSEKYTEHFIERTEKSLRNLNINDYEIILVDDGSPDNSYEIACEIAKKNKKLKLIKLSRNYGQPYALTAGLEHSSGSKIFLIDSDLEEDPEWLEIFYKELDTSKYDCVYGLQKKRKGNLFERISGRIFYDILNFFSDIKILPSPVTSRIMTRRYLNSLLKFSERNLSIGMLCALNGYTQKGIFVNKKELSPSNYSPLKKLRMGISTILFMSSKPLEIIIYSGLIICILSIVAVFYLLYLYFMRNILVPGWASIFISLVFFSGINLFFMGVIGLYIKTIFSEVKNRPRYIIQEIINERSNERNNFN